MERKKVTFEEAISSDQTQLLSWYKDHVNPMLATLFKLVGLDRRYVKAEGAYLYDTKGERYIDLFSGYGAVNIGHSHPRIFKALEQIYGSPVLVQASLNPFTPALAATLAAITPGELEICFFSNSGAEAVEAALKMARAASGKPYFVYTENSFHGKTFGALSVTGRDKYRIPFEPLIKETRKVPFGDIESLERALSSGDVAAFIVEPIQGEGGVVIPPDGYLAKAQKLCREYDALFIIDEIQTGFGRTGTLFAIEREGIEPDIMCLSKALGGGFVPIGATVAKRNIWDRAYGGVERCLLHTSTQGGGNALICAVALETVNIVIDEGLPERSSELGEWFLKLMQEVTKDSPLVRSVRGRGLMIGLEFEPYEGVFAKITRGVATDVSKEYTAHLVAAELLEKHKILTVYTLNNPNVIRIQPPLIIKKEDLEYAANALADVLSTKSFIKLAAKRGSRLVGKFLGGQR